MKRLLPLLFLAMNLLLPAGMLLPLFGWSLEITRPAALMLLMTAASALLALAGLCTAPDAPPLLPRLLLPTAAAVNGLLLIAENHRLPWVGLPALILFASSLVFCRGLRRSFPLALVKFILHGIPGAALVLMALLTLLLSGFGAEYAFPEVVSPDGAYAASAVISDQGALGGDTIIRVYRAGGPDLGVLKIRRQAMETYYDDWRRPDSFRMEWTDSHTLLVSGKEYRIE